MPVKLFHVDTEVRCGLLGIQVGRLDRGRFRQGRQALREIALAPKNLWTEADPIKAAREAEVLVAFGRKAPLISRPMIEVLASDSIIFDAGIGSVSDEAIGYGNEHGIRIVRPDMRATLAAELTSILGTAHIVNELMGRGEIGGIPVVAGGLVGQYGEVVLDSISNPSKVIGVADGQGRVIYERRKEFREKLQKVEEEILRKQVLPE